MIKLTSDGEAMVDTETHWIPIQEKAPPVGVKVQLINQHNRSAAIGRYSPRYNWTHWYPLPTFKKSS